MDESMAGVARSNRGQEFRLLGSLFCTYLGSSITATASTIFLVQRFGVGGASGLALVLQLVPNLLLGPVAGELVSRVNPKSAATSGSLGVGVAVLGYLLIDQAWQAQVVSFLVGTAGVIGIPARMALRASVLSADRLRFSTGAIIAAERLGLVLGPLIASAVAVVIHVEAAFVLEFVLALIAVITLAGLRPRETDCSSPTGGGLRAVYRRAWKLMSGDRVVWEYSLSGFVYLVGVGVRRLLFPAALILTLASSEDRLGVLVGAMAVGGILGVWSHRRSTSRRTTGSSCCRRASKCCSGWHSGSRRPSSCSCRSWWVRASSRDPPRRSTSSGCKIGSGPTRSAATSR